MTYSSLMEALDALVSEIEHAHGGQMTREQWCALELRRDRISRVLDRLDGATKQDAARRVA